MKRGWGSNKCSFIIIIILCCTFINNVITDHRWVNQKMNIDDRETSTYLPTTFYQVNNILYGCDTIPKAIPSNPTNRHHFFHHHHDKKVGVKKVVNLTIFLQDFPNLLAKMSVFLVFLKLQIQLCRYLGVISFKSYDNKSHDKSNSGATLKV